MGGHLAVKRRALHPRRMHEVWFRLEDPSSDAVAALRFTRSQLQEVAGGDSSAWRWVVLGLHLALQDFVLAAFPSNVLAMDDKRAARFVSGIEEGLASEELPKLRVDWFPNLYDRMKEVTGYSPGPQVDEFLVGGSDGTVESLHSLRSSLVHHFPGSWSISTTLLLKRVDAALAVIAHLGWQQQYTNHVYWREDSSRELAREELDRCLQLVSELRDAGL